MLYGELGLSPLGLYINKRMVSYWCNVVNNNPEKLTRQLYDIMYHESLGNPHRFKWLGCISNVLQNSGFNFLWNRQGNITTNMNF